MKNYNILTNFFKKPNKRVLGLKNNNNWYWMSNEHMIKNINDASNILTSLSVNKGDRIVYQGKNSLEWLSWNLAVQSKGAIWVPMYADQSKEYCQYIVNDCTPKIAITDGTNYYSNTVNIDNKINSSGYSNEKEINIVDTNKDDISTLIYTSGTTGNPKGVMLSHDNLTSNIKTLESRFKDINYKTTSLNILPWAHVYSLTTELYYNLYRNNSIAITSDKTTFINEMREVRPNVLYIVPRILDLIKQKLDKYDIPLFNHTISYILKYMLGGNIKYIFIGGAKLNDSTKFFFIRNGIKICEGYGTTETSPMISVNHYSHPRNIYSIGKILDNIEVHIENGEILVSGPNIMKGYWNNLEKTNEVLINRNNKLWYKTGDSGYLRKGFLYYNGRIGDNYKLSNGKFVNVNEIESKIKRYIPTNFIVYGEGMDSSILIVEKPFNNSTLNIINKKLDKHLHISDVIHVDDFSKYLTPKMSIKRKLLIKDFIKN
uniref:AMP-dependent synthetase/ligase domain-containing protein n=1 Tax=viral metagenome TaxID=1070528 RepID=A0A6C0AVR6_9ZZZZ|tara:strand:+ start:3643 stop:5103 length:1461 start_codon:yes stop_codon:yes gene_type:complete